VSFEKFTFLGPGPLPQLSFDIFVADVSLFLVISCHDFVIGEGALWWPCLLLLLQHR
jgi:hypothetical protein